MSKHDETTEAEAPTVEDGAMEDFDQFWRDREASGKRKRKATTIMGERVELPAEVPIFFELEAKRLRKSKDDKDVRRLVAILFGDKALDTWSRKGMDREQFAVLLAWAPLAIAGANITLAEVADMLASETAKDSDPS